MPTRLLLAFLLISSHAQAQWMGLPAFPGTARDDAASFSFGSLVCVGTGMDVGFELTNDWYRYDTDGQSWGPMASLPASGRQYCSAFVLNGIGYLFGGVDASGPLNELWSYDPVLDHWAQLASLPDEGRFAAVAFAPANFGFVCTGMTASGTPTNQLWRYDPATDVWDQRSDFPGQPRHRAMAIMNIVVGGADELFTALADGWSYSSDLDSWAPIQSLPSARYGSATFEWGGGGIIAGASSSSSYHDDVFWYDENSGTWSPQFGPIIGARKGSVSGLGTYSNGYWMFFGTGSDGVQRYGDWQTLGFPLSIHETKSTPAFALLPVPTNSSLNIRMQDRGDWQTWRISGPDGGLLMQGPVRTTSIEVATSSLAPGAYLLSLVGIHGTATQRFTVVH